MAQEYSTTRKTIGRPPGKIRPPTKPVQVALETLERVDAWIGRQPEPRPSRPEAIRQLVEQALGAPDAGFIAAEDLNASNDE